MEQIALTEHLFRFDQADRVLHGWWNDETDPRLKQQLADYWTDHVSADLDAYIETCLAAKRAGLPVVVGMEVDYYPGRMHIVENLLRDYPFDVLLGSVHWLETWMFDDLGSQIAMGEWDTRKVEDVWDALHAVPRRTGRHPSFTDVLAHPVDLRKVAGYRPTQTDEVATTRMAEAAAAHDMAAEVSLAGWRKPSSRSNTRVSSLLSRFHAKGVKITTTPSQTPTA